MWNSRYSTGLVAGVFQIEKKKSLNAGWVSRQ